MFLFKFNSHVLVLVFLIIKTLDSLFKHSNSVYFSLLLSISHILPQIQSN
jgi:hypothetical protein